ncbi:unnamed protein product [Closterium sp. NIES-65]|nr:unnamed protein product [Closterium sp. NIES-65]
MSPASLASPASPVMAAPVGGSAAQGGESGAQAVGRSGLGAAGSSARSGGANAPAVGGSGTRTIGGITARAAGGGGARAVVRVVRADGMDVEAQLRLEEKLLRSDPTNSNWFVFNADVAAPTIVMGISGKPHELLHTEAVLEARVPVVRRFSGGGTVVLDSGSVLTSLICRRAAVPDLPLYPRPIMEWTEGLLGPAMTNVPGFALRDNDYVPCPVGQPQYTPIPTSLHHHCATSSDYVVGDLKVGGNAQSIMGSSFLHHTSFLWDFCSHRMALLQQPSRAPEYRQVSLWHIVLIWGTPAAKTIVLPAKAGKHAATVVWLHGLGDTGYGWSDLCETVNLPHIKWILPSAPIASVTINGGMPCPSWFDLFGLDASARDDVKGIDAAARYVAGILEEEKRANPGGCSAVLID